MSRSVASLFAVPSHMLGDEPEPRDRYEEGRMRLSYYDVMGIEPDPLRDALASAAWMERQLVPMGLDSQSFWDSAFERSPLPARLRRRAVVTDPDVGQLGVSLYRVQTACERAGRWQIEAFVSDEDEADRMVEAFQARGERANVTTIDLSDPLERDSVCHNLTAFFQSLKARKSVDLYPSDHLSAADKAAGADGK